jgi:hypothetical protein
MAVSEQWLCKHIPVEMNMHTTIEEQCFRCRLSRGAIKKITGAIQSIEAWQLKAEFCKGG